VKFSSYCPFTIRVWVNGHEWAKRQFEQAGVRFESLDNGFLSVSDPTRAQAICDRLTPADIEAFFRRWLARLPHPFSRADRAAGYRYRLSILQMEMSRRAPSAPSTVGSRHSTGVLALSTLDCGRSTRGAAAPDRRISRRTPGSFRTRVLTVGVEPTGRLRRRPQSTVHSRQMPVPVDYRLWTVDARRRRADHLRRIGRNANRRLLTVERLSHNCTIGSGTFERIVLPATDENGQPHPGLRFGEPRVMALLAALCLNLHLPNRFSNRTLRCAVAALQGKDPAHYSPGQMSYDLRRMRLKGLIRRLPGSHRYLVTPAGRRIALFFSKTYARVLRPGLDRLDAPPPFDAPHPLTTAWRSLDQALAKLVHHARLAA
jgi:hypothetical protein